VSIPQAIANKINMVVTNKDEEKMSKIVDEAIENILLATQNDPVVNEATHDAISEFLINFSFLWEFSG
jgi:hypothetical protein